MSVCIEYPDNITLVSTTVDGYGKLVIDDEEDVQAIFEMATGYAHTDNQEAITSDAIAFVSPEDEFVADNFYRLEEMLVVADLFGSSDDQSWFKVVNVIVSRDSQLCNTIDNVQLQLKKTSPLEGHVS